jgi:tRNA-dihydrouridine synthase
MNIWEDLPKPFFVLAPMDDVTETVFRQVVADCARPDLFFTEFVNVDALQSKGREATLRRLKLGPNEGLRRFSHADGVQGASEKRTEPRRYRRGDGASELATTRQSAARTVSVTSSDGQQGSSVRKPMPIVAQLWGLNPKNFYKSAQQLADGILVDEANWLRTKHGDAVQGTGEARNETYKRYGEVSTGANDAVMRPKRGSVASSAGQQADVVLSFAGVDLNFGCPDKNVVRNGACSAFILPENRSRAVEIIQATKEGLAAGASGAANFTGRQRRAVHAPGSLPLSVKTRLWLQRS